MLRRTRTIFPLICLCVALGLPALPAGAQEAEIKASSLSELLKMVQEGWRSEQRSNKKREAEFKAAKQEQARLLQEARATQASEEQRSENLERSFEDNELRLAELEELLASRLGNLGELFGVVRQVAGDTSGQVENSLISSQVSGREEFLGRLGQSKALPSIESLERLWAVLLEEMTESSKVTRYTAPVISVDGSESERQVTRVGVFNAVADGAYLKWSPERGRLAELGRQPAAKYLDTTAELESATGGFVNFALDPARGAILALLIQAPSFQERIEFGGVVGYTIIVLGALTLLLGMVRMLALVWVSTRVKLQRRNPGEPGANPLGRVLAIYADGRSLDTEALELKMEEQILHESTKLERFLWMIKVVAAVAPLMGLLGTVTGMIRTFQAITLFGTGDPKMMAGGISEALVTTMLGLCAAIPLVLLHSWLSSLSKGVIDVLEEQSAGLMAKQVERETAGRGAEGADGG
ncbi:MAG: MotA/TolQ/ExbB proton channel family protein [Deltaproteobacteria bacterium]|nr:MotA/TolQ/ExbB proton channel family protein [Deltaproteobacteria bacterium]MBW2419399.1 MotA/TolQ/ExbB proton channel family protein [Deltaproteobacteria bacterium]